MNFKELFEKIENKYGQEYVVETFYNGLKVETIRIKNEYFEVLVPSYATSKNDLMVKTFSLTYYNTIESIVNAVNRLLKQK